MQHRYSQLIVWLCTVVLFLAPAAAIYYLVELDAFIELAKSQLNLAIQWATVTDMQWYGLWGLTLLSVLPALIGIYFLRRAFIRFARGEFFNAINSHHLRLFSLFIFVQAVTSPLHFLLSSLLLSANHPAGQKILAITFGSNDIKTIVFAMIFWVLSDLLVKASRLETENKQFV